MAGQNQPNMLPSVPERRNKVFNISRFGHGTIYQPYQVSGYISQDIRKVDAAFDWLIVNRVLSNGMSMNTQFTQT